jgi:hypothetical protein
VRTGLPHDGQKRAPGGSASEHDAQRAATGVPHCAQKRESGASSALHDGHACMCLSVTER